MKEQIESIKQKSIKEIETANDLKQLNAETKVEKVVSETGESDGNTE